MSRYMVWLDGATSADDPAFIDAPTAEDAAVRYAKHFAAKHYPAGMVPPDMTVKVVEVGRRQSTATAWRIIVTVEPAYSAWQINEGKRR